jgi:hypothetical protein
MLVSPSDAAAGGVSGIKTPSDSMTRSAAP